MARRIASGVRRIRAIPRIGEIGGSSGCSASFTPASAATGTTRSMKRPRLSQSVSSLTSPAGVYGAFRISAWSYEVTSAPPRLGVVVEVRVQLKTDIQFQQTTGTPTAPRLRISVQQRSISSSAPGNPNFAACNQGKPVSITSSVSPASAKRVFIRSSGRNSHPGPSTSSGGTCDTACVTPACRANVQVAFGNGGRYSASLNIGFFQYGG